MQISLYEIFKLIKFKFDLVVVLSLTLLDLISTRFSLINLIYLDFGYV